MSMMMIGKEKSRCVNASTGDCARKRPTLPGWRTARVLDFKVGRSEPPSRRGPPSRRVTEVRTSGPRAHATARDQWSEHLRICSEHLQQLLRPDAATAPSRCTSAPEQMCICSRADVTLLPSRCDTAREAVSSSAAFLRRHCSDHIATSGAAAPQLSCGAAAAEPPRSREARSGTMAAPALCARSNSTAACRMESLGRQNGACSDEDCEG